MGSAARVTFVWLGVRTDWEPHYARRQCIRQSLKGGAAVPLSDEEVQKLREIEAQLESDERFVQAVSPSGLYRPAVKKVRWAALGAVVSLALVFVGLQLHFAAGFAGFALMLACVLIIERELRTMGKVGVRDLSSMLRTTREQAKKFRDKMGREQ